MATIKKFEEIIAWQKARGLNQRIGDYIDLGRFKTNYRLINQIEGSAGSIMDNIAEGFERSGNREFLQFLLHFKRSCGEFRSQLYRALDRKYISEEKFEELYGMAKEIIIRLQKLIQHLDSSEIKGTKFKTRTKTNMQTSEQANR